MSGRREESLALEPAALDVAVVKLLQAHAVTLPMSRVEILSRLDLTFGDDGALTRSLARLSRQGLIAFSRDRGWSTGWRYVHARPKRVKR